MLVRVLAVVLGMTPQVVFAHARLVKSQPAAEALLSKPPARITLWFSEPPENNFSTIDLSDAKKKPIALSPLTAAADQGLTVQITQTLTPGTYRVRYRVLSQDGHVIKASFKFTVNPEAR